MDTVGAALAALGVAGALLPFATLKANRIVPGAGQALWASLSPVEAGALALVLLAAALALVARTGPALRLSASLGGLLALGFGIGAAAQHLTPAGNTFARVAPASGFWLLAFSFALLVTDALTRLRLRAGGRLIALGVAVAALALFLVSGAWDGLSVLKEYHARADTFWAQAEAHVALAFGSLGVAALLGLPLGLLCHRSRRLRAAVLPALNLVQTIPSIALFGLLIAPLGWVALHVPGAAALGVRGIGAAPAFVALVLYALLPVVANTVVGLGNVSPALNDAARGVGMTDRQRLLRVELPLAWPVILTGLRIVLVQNIGLATIAALIGGGGFGVFVFQGVGQTALDLVLLGAAPTVALAAASAVALDALVEWSERRGSA